MFCPTRFYFPVMLFRTTRNVNQSGPGVKATTKSSNILLSFRLGVGTRWAQNYRLRPLAFLHALARLGQAFRSAHNL